MLVQKTVATNTNFAGRLSEAMLRKTGRDSKSSHAKFEGIFAIRKIKRINPIWAASRGDDLEKAKTTTDFTDRHG